MEPPEDPDSASVPELVEGPPPSPRMSPPPTNPHSSDGILETGTQRESEVEGQVVSEVPLDTTSEPSPAVAGIPPTRPASLPSMTKAAPARRSDSRWRQFYARRLWLSDLLVLIWVAYGTQIIWFGAGEAQVAMREDSRITEFSYWVFSGLLVVVWMWALSLFDSRSFRVVGTGATEYIHVARASFSLFGLIAIFAFLVRVDIARGYLLIALPLGIFMLVLERWLWRQWLIAKRSTGEYSARVLLVGPRESVSTIGQQLQRTPSAGYKVVGACVPRGMPSEVLGGGIPVLGDIDAVESVMAQAGADTVTITSTEELPPERVKQISWSLEAGRQHLVMAPSIVDIAGPRIHTRPVAGLPLIHVETPSFSRGQRVLKRTMDLIISILGAIVSSPLLLGLAIAVRMSGPGSVIFRQTRIGRGGAEFEMLKFRSMVQNAEDLLPSLLDQRDAGNEVLFKMTDDPRVTRIGRVMRRYSLDELPQLINVVMGEMSLVGPRPPLPSEVEKYADHVHRRFLMKPGITGAWQVSGRSSLSWEESVRLDLAYVENWSVLADGVILLKTIRAAMTPQGTAH